MTSLGATVTSDGIRFAVWSSSARRLWVSIFDATGSREIDRLELLPEGEGVHEDGLSLPPLGFFVGRAG